MLKIAIVGPESSGKTTLTEALAHHYGCVWVKEFARVALEERGPAYTEHDLLEFASGQLLALGEGIELAKMTPPRIVFCDTDIITIRIWSLDVFGRCDPLIEQLARQVTFDHWFLCRPDIPWEPDALRENPHDRYRIFDLYQGTLEQFGKPYTVIEGDRTERMRRAMQAVGTLPMKG